MGDRALVIFKDRNGEYSPVTYLHWSGYAVPTLLAEHKKLMDGRFGDLSYATARFIGICHEHVDGNTSLGCWSLEEGDVKGLKACEETFCEGYSHGDAGVFIVDVGDMTWKQYGGYEPETVEVA